MDIFQNEWLKSKHGSEKFQSLHCGLQVLVQGPADIGLCAQVQVDMFRIAEEGFSY